mmetsp:Transcript_112999/g.364840  ORF Transcript_112999/g.364840 Transcript_112999/m.364840 type:complete len:259 (+) Transcript_112999:1426-2202(+)
MHADEQRGGLLREHEVERQVVRAHPDAVALCRAPQRHRRRAQAPASGQEAVADPDGPARHDNRGQHHGLGEQRVPVGKQPPLPMPAHRQRLKLLCGQLVVTQPDGSGQCAPQGRQQLARGGREGIGVGTEVLDHHCHRAVRLRVHPHTPGGHVCEGVRKQNLRKGAVLSGDADKSRSLPLHGLLQCPCAKVGVTAWQFSRVCSCRLEVLQRWERLRYRRARVNYIDGKDTVVGTRTDEVLPPHQSLQAVHGIGLFSRG